MTSHSRRIAVELKIAQTDLDAVLRICTTLHVSWEKWLAEALDSGMRRKMGQDWEKIRHENLASTPSPIDPADEATLLSDRQTGRPPYHLAPFVPAEPEQAS